jgi:hypothetical protein
MSNVTLWQATPQPANWDAQDYMMSLVNDRMDTSIPVPSWQTDPAPKLFLSFEDEAMWGEAMNCSGSGRRDGLGLLGVRSADSDAEWYQQRVKEVLEEADFY